MAASLPSWTDVNTDRRYPLSDAATGIDDTGFPLPDGLIADLKMILPRYAGERVYLGSATIRDLVLSLVFVAVDQSGNTVPVATYRGRRPREFEKIPLEPMYPNVQGWIVFSSLTDVPNYSGSFSSVEQAEISPRAAFWFREPKITSAGVPGSTPLTGLIHLQGGSDIEITSVCLPLYGAENQAKYADASCGEVDGIPQTKAIRIALSNTLEGTTTDTLSRYAGKCGGRPESRSCNGPTPIERIGNVAADCCGNVNIVFTGCAHVSEVTGVARYDEGNNLIVGDEASGVVLDCGVGLAEVCAVTDTLPDAEGNLRNQREDLCEEPQGGGGGGSVIIEPELTFDDVAAVAAVDSRIPNTIGLSPPTNWSVKSGTFVEEGGGLRAEGVSGRNLVVYDQGGLPFGDYKKAALTATPLYGGAGRLNNVGVIANYKKPIDGPDSYVLLEMDIHGATFGYPAARVVKWDGASYSTLSSVPVPEAGYNVEYTLSLSVIGVDVDGNGWVLGEVTSPSLGIDVTLGPVYVEGYGDATGLYGAQTHRARAQLSSLALTNVVAYP